MSRPLRADAARNRTRILEVADAVFAEHGTGVATEEVARAAGVGIGTVFRHFPTKEDLLVEVLRGRLESVAADIEAAAARDDPGAALREVFRRTVERSPEKLALADALAAAGRDPAPALAEVGARLRAALAGLLGRAQQAGRARGDVGVEELVALLSGASQALAQAGPDDAVRSRVLTVVLDGLMNP